MWCTRWYLPLLLLPFPIAPPYYLMLWLFSISMHARPCFYCMALLSTMYISMCYWPPVPIDTPLARPWAENVTTFADALRHKMPDLPQEGVPDMMPIHEFCWCDFMDGFFSPVNVTRWEEGSVNRLVEKLEKKMVADKEALTKKHCEGADGDATNANGTNCTDELAAISVRKRRRRKVAFLSLLDVFGLVPAPAKTSHPLPSTSESPSTSEPPHPSNSAVPKEEEPERSGEEPKRNTNHEQPSAQLPWLRREYDLRRFGFAMVLDFGWPSARS